MFWEGGFCQWEMSALPLALADREGFCVRWSGWASPLPAQCELRLPLTLSKGRTLVEQCHDWSISTESHHHWPVWCDAYSSPSIWPGFPEGHRKYCPLRMYHVSWKMPMTYMKYTFAPWIYSRHSVAGWKEGSLLQGCSQSSWGWSWS